MNKNLYDKQVKKTMSQNTSDHYFNETQEHFSFYSE